MREGALEFIHMEAHGGFTRDSYDYACTLQGKLTTTRSPQISFGVFVPCLENPSLKTLFPILASSRAVVSLSSLDAEYREKVGQK